MAQFGSETVDIRGKRILITGGAGFIGASLAERLVDNNEVVIYDNRSRDAIGSMEVARHSNIRLIVGDVLCLNDVRKAVEGCDIIVHAAGIAGIDTVIKSPIRTMEVNMIGSANVLKAASELDRCARVICFSTSEIFGEKAIGSAEGDRAVVGAVGEARWTYAVSKLAEEHLAIAYHKELGLPTVVLRPFNIYGPNQVGEGALKTFVQRALSNLPLEIRGDGTQIRAWCYVDDMVDALVRAMQHPRAVGETFNIGNARSVTTIHGLANTVVRVLNSGSPILFTDKPQADIELRYPSIGKARDLLGFEARVALEEGILRTAAFFSEASGWLESSTARTLYRESLGRTN